MAPFLGLCLVQAVVWTALVLSALVLRRRWRRAEPLAQAGGEDAQSAILVPIKGLDAGLPEALRRLAAACDAQTEVLFGLARADDPAAATLRSFVEQHATLRTRVIITGEPTAVNPKVAQLRVLVDETTAPLLLLVDGNTWVEPTLPAVARGVFVDGRVGIGSPIVVLAPRAGLWNHVRAAYLTGFIASVASLVSLAGSSLVVGKCIAVRRSTLEAIGGIWTCSNVMAEDGVLLRRIVRAGFVARTLPTVVVAAFDGFTLTGLWRHQLRWSRLVAWQAPGSVLVEQLLCNPLVVVAIALARGSTPALEVAALTVAYAMIGRAVAVAGWSGRPQDALAAPLSDLLMLPLSLWATVGRRIRWRERSFVIGTGTAIRSERVDGT